MATKSKPWKQYSLEHSPFCSKLRGGTGGTNTWSKRVRNRNLEAVPSTMLWKGCKSLFRLIGGGQRAYGNHLIASHRWWLNKCNESQIWQMHEWISKRINTWIKVRMCQYAVIIYNIGTWWYTHYSRIIITNQIIKPEFNSKCIQNHTNISKYVCIQCSWEQICTHVCHVW